MFSGKGLVCKAFGQREGGRIEGRVDGWKEGWKRLNADLAIHKVSGRNLSL